MEYKNEHFTGERARFQSFEDTYDNCLFDDGESPLKESQKIIVKNSTFGWKYPLWYTKDVLVTDTLFKDTAKSGLWYVDNITLKNCKIDAPKEFRRSKNITLKDVEFTNSMETLWKCENITFDNVKAKGTYLAMNSTNIVISNLDLEGDYCFDGSNNIEIKNSKLISKDAFWNCENVLIENCYIDGEYFGWNSKNITLKNCTITSHQGFCYMKDIKLIDCKIIDSDLIFEYCENLSADIKSKVSSIKNPISGNIIVDDYDELILNDSNIDFSKVKITKR